MPGKKPTKKNKLNRVRINTSLSQETITILEAVKKVNNKSNGSNIDVAVKEYFSGNAESLIREKYKFLNEIQRINQMLMEFDEDHIETVTLRIQKEIGWIDK